MNKFHIRWLSTIKEIRSIKDFKIIGTRHGEKLFETLVSREEMIRSMQMKKYFRIKSDDRDLNYENYFNSGKKNISKCFSVPYVFSYN